ncbi:MAG: hypothetical protein ACYDEB_07695 [Dehalococcoidia bacterium]
MQSTFRITLVAVAAGLVTLALGVGAMSAGAQSVPVNPMPTPSIASPVNPPVAPPASPIQPPSAPVSTNPAGGQLGVNGAPAALPNSGTGPSQSRGNNAIFFILAGTGLALAAAGVATRRHARQR